MLLAGAALRKVHLLPLGDELLRGHPYSLLALVCATGLASACVERIGRRLRWGKPVVTIPPKHGRDVFR